MSGSTSMKTPSSQHCVKRALGTTAVMESTSSPASETLHGRQPPLAIAGLIPFSATDWPGRLTATVFTQGCPLACRYCHNSQLQPFSPGQVDLPEVFSLLEQRRGLLDGLVISGGEPTAQRGLAEAIAGVHQRGFPVGLHTCGYLPARIERLLASPETTPDWVGFDIKALPRDFAHVTGGTPTQAIGNWESLRLLSDAGVAMQVRTTIWPESVVADHLGELDAAVAQLGHELVVQTARGVGADGRYVQAAPATPVT